MRILLKKISSYMFWMNKVPKRLQQLTSGLKITMHNKRNKRSKTKIIILVVDPVILETPVVLVTLVALVTAAQIMEEIPVEVVPISVGVLVLLVGCGLLPVRMD